MYNKRRMVGIYKITNPKGKSYIGLSREIEVRWNSYKNMQFQSKNTKLRESIENYGYENHIFEVLEEIKLTKDTYGKNTALLRKRERYWIKELDTFNNGLNSNGGGSGCNSHTEESKRLIGEANRKPKPKDFGKNRKKWQHTPEFREKISKANKGKTSYWKGKVHPNKGKIMSQEQKDKISKANKGVSKPTAGGKGKPKPRAGGKKALIHLNTGITYNSVSEAAKILNLPRAGISLCCNGKRKSTKGNTFQFIENSI